MARGLTGEELAQKAGLNYATIHRAEIGRAIRVEAVNKIAEALDIPEDVVCYSTGQLTKEKIKLIKEDPLFFKEIIDHAFSDPSKLTKTKEYIENLNAKMKIISPDVSKFLSKVKAPK